MNTTGVRGTLAWVLLGTVAGLFGLVTGLPDGAGAFVAVAGVAIGGALRQPAGFPRGRAFAPVPVVIGLVSVASLSSLGLVPEILAGASGVALLVWLADDPGRPAGGPARAQLTIAVPALALGIAWASALLLPSDAASLGVAVGLLVFVLAAVAYLVGQPSTYDRDASSP